MRIRATKIEMIPGNEGKNCPGNGEHYDNKGRLIECMCDECDYFLLCFEEWADFVHGKIRCEAQASEDE